MIKNILLDPGIIPYIQLKESINKYLFSNKLAIINVNPYKNDWDQLKTKCELISYTQLENDKCYDFNSKIINDYVPLLQNIINDHRTLLIFERVKSIFAWNSLFNGIQTIEIIIVNCVKLLIRLQPSLLLFQATPHNLPSWVLAKTAEFLGIKVAMIQTTPLPWRFWLVEGLNEQKPIFPFQQIPITEKDSKIFDKFWQINISDYQTALPNYERERIQSRGGKYWSWKKELSDCLKHPKLLLSLIPKRILFNTYNSCFQIPDLSTKYVVFFLHYQPERTSLPDGGFFAQQWLIIRQLCIGLPKGWMLLIKEHPSTFTGRYNIKYRNPEFYKRIVRLPNVNLVSIETDTFNLIDSCQFIATISGTVGVQALIRGKPVLIFGKASYRGAFGTACIDDYKDINNAINKLLKMLNANSIQDEIKKYLKSVENMSISGIEKLDNGDNVVIYDRRVRINGHLNLLSNYLAE